MPRLLIGNDFNENMREDRKWVDWWVQRLAWFAENDDILVLPTEPQRPFFEYVTDLLVTDLDSLQFVIPPNENSADGCLTAERLGDRDFHASLRKAIGDREISEVFALWPDASVARLARSVGVHGRLPGAGFIEQGGGFLANSKAAFRAVAGGVGVPLPPGGVCASRADAESLITEMLEHDEIVMLKHDHLSGARGNEILSPVPGVRPVGARRVVPVPDRSAVRSYLLDRWDWLSGGGRSHVIVERYYRDSTAVFAEFDINDRESVFAGEGEMVCAPFGIGEIMPTPGLDPATLDEVVDGGHRICEALRMIGYRGTLSADAIVTPEQDVFFTEYNGRVTGSTHIYGVIGQRLVGADYAQDRVLMERIWPSDWSVPSFDEALSRITEAGLAYDVGARTGVVLSSAFDRHEQAIVHVIVAEDLDAAWDRQARMKELFSGA